MYYQNHKKQETEKQYIADLTVLSGGPPEKGLANKIVFCAVLIMNGILYNESQAHEGAEGLRKYVRESLYDKIQAGNSYFPTSDSRTNFSSRNS